MTDDLVAHAVAACAASLRTPEGDAIGRTLASRGVDASALYAMVARVTEDSASQSPLRSLKGDAESAEGAEPDAFERFVIRSAAVTRPPDTATVSEGVTRLLADTLEGLAAPSSEGARLSIGSSRFVTMCKIVTGRRFPAGQFDWEISGVPRSALLRVPPLRIPSVLAFVAFRMGGLGPVMFSHLSPFRTIKALDEAEANRSYARMAASLERQPDVKGFAAWSWFRSPGTHAVSPHLAWMSRVFLEHGGFVSECGPDDPAHGALHRSATRRRLYEQGKYVPTKGLVMWPRRAMIAWARSHPELQEWQRGGPVVVQKGLT